MDPATAEYRKKLRDKEEDDMIKYGYVGYWKNIRAIIKLKVSH
jgi:hypothetical protein